MPNSIWKNKTSHSFWGLLPGIATFVVIAALVVYGLVNVGRGSMDEGQRLLEESLRRAAVSCYAIEGRYPPSLDYLVTYYGVVIDSERYDVFYTGVFASNILPEITVIPKEVR
jgi:hypothetical protein